MGSGALGEITGKRDYIQFKDPEKASPRGDISERIRLRHLTSGAGGKVIC